MDKEQLNQLIYCSCLKKVEEILRKSFFKRCFCYVIKAHCCSYIHAEFTVFLSFNYRSEGHLCLPVRYTHAFPEALDKLRRGEFRCVFTHEWLLTFFWWTLGSVHYHHLIPGNSHTLHVSYFMSCYHRKKKKEKVENQVKSNPECVTDSCNLVNVLGAVDLLATSLDFKASLNLFLAGTRHMGSKCVLLCPQSVWDRLTSVTVL